MLFNDINTTATTVFSAIINNSNDIIRLANEARIEAIGIKNR